MPQNATKRHKTPQNATKRHNFFVARKFREKRSFFVKSFGRDRLIASNGKTGKCHFVAVGFAGWVGGFWQWAREVRTF
jgi:hypothetical protein